VAIGTAKVRVSALIVVCCLALSFGGAQAEDTRYLGEREPGRHALVIGNSTYVHAGQIPSAALDAERVAERLTRLGFEVKVVLGVASSRQFEDEILPVFRQTVEPGDLVVFYFSGHGFTYGPDNFLAPLDLPLTLRESQVVDVAISVENLEDYFGKRTPGLIVLLIDACRTIGGFVIADMMNNNVVGKSLAEPRYRSRNVNTVIGFATRPGREALGSAAADKLSIFTSSLVAHLADVDWEFDRLFKQVASEVLEATDDRQQPGLWDWSATELYLNPSQAILGLQKEAWLAALGSNKRESVQRFTRRFAMSRHAAAARQWLIDNPVSSGAPRFTLVSPAAVERVWRPGESKFAISPAWVGFAYPRTVNVHEKKIADLGDSALGLVPSGAKASGTKASSVRWALEALEAHEAVVTTKEYLARAAPSRRAAVVARLPYGTRISIDDVKTGAANDLWVAARLSGEGEAVYLPVSVADAASTPVELGQALREVVALPPVGGLRDLVEPSALRKAIVALRADGRTVTWVSIATGATEDPDEADSRAARLTHVEYLLKRAGIDGRRITSVTMADDLPGPGVRVRFFGY
jgi:hypothetical protein